MGTLYLVHGKDACDLRNWTLWRIENQKTSCPNGVSGVEFALLPLRYVYGLHRRLVMSGPG